MKFLVAFAVLSSVALSSSVVQADHHHIKWLEYLSGEWTYEWSAEKGDFSEKGTIRWRKAAKQNVLIGNIQTENGDSEVELVGWNPETKSLVVTGYSSNGGCWHIVYSELKADRAVAKSASGIMPDKHSWKADKWVLEKVNEKEFVIRSEGTAGGKPLVTTGKFARKAE